MAELQLTLTTKERDCLVNVLETSLSEMRREEHRTRAPLYREQILEREQLIAAILSKLGAPSQ